jgi:TonB family protein
MKIKITSPCSENWDVMKPENNSRFCDSCEKNVMDFTKMEKEDIIRFMLRNKNNNICGRIDNGLMKFSHDELMSVINKELITNKRTNYGFYLMLLGTLSIMSCTNNTENNIQNLAQDSKTTLLITETAKVQNIKDSDSLNKPNNKIHTPKIESKNSVLQKELDDKGVETLKGNVTCAPDEVIINTPVGGVAIIQENYNDPNAVYSNVEILPMFKGGLDELGSFITKTLKYPKYEKENKIEGRVYVSFIVEKDGRVTNPSIVRIPPDSKNFGEEVLRIMRLMPKWKPGLQKGQAVRVSYTLPIIFELDKLK